MASTWRPRWRTDPAPAERLTGRFAGPAPGLAVRARCEPSPATPGADFMAAVRPAPERPKAASESLKRSAGAGRPGGPRAT